jgi:hypothetical protein
VTAYNELSSFQVKSGKGYDKRSVEQFRALALGIVDELMRESTGLRDQLSAGPVPPPPAAHGAPMLTADEEALLARYRSADGAQRQAMLTGPAFISAPMVVQPPSTSSQPSTTELMWGFDSASSPPVAPPVTPAPPALSPANDTPWPDFTAADPLRMPAAPAETEAVPEWMTSFDDVPTTSDRGSNWFLDGAFGGDVPEEAYASAHVQHPDELAWPDVADSGQGWVVDSDDWPASLDAALDSPPSPEWTDLPDDSLANSSTGESAPDTWVSAQSPDPWAAAPSAWLSAPEPPSSTSKAPFAAPPSAWVLESPSGDGGWPLAPPTEQFASSPGMPPGLLDAGEPASGFGAPSLDGARGPEGGIDALFDQLDFGPPATNMLEVARFVEPPTPVSPAGSPLHVDRPAVVGATLPEPVAPWSGWISPS